MAELEPGRVGSCRCVCVCLQVEEVDARARRGSRRRTQGLDAASASAFGILDEERDGGRRRHGRADEWLRRRQRRRGHLQPWLRGRTGLLLQLRPPSPLRSGCHRHRAERGHGFAWRGTG